MQRLSALGVILTIGINAFAAVPEAPMEQRVIADGDNDAVWHAAEARMAPDARHARKGRAMHFHVDVDHHAGEPKYPIGWPRAYTSVDPEQRDWLHWDFVEFWVYADSSRERLPGLPLGFIVRAPDRDNSFHASLSAVQKGEWVHFRFPTASIPNAKNCTAIQFFISESNYAHGDVVDFWIDNVQLLRYAEPTVLAVRPLNKVLYADCFVLRIEIEMTGLNDREAVAVEAGLRRNGHTIHKASVPLGAGISTIPLPIQGGSPGDYRVYAKVAGTEGTLTETVQIVSSPWEEKPE